MQANKKNMLLLITFVSIFLLSGCPVPQGPVEVILPPNSVEDQQRNSVQKRFQEPAPQGPTVIESAIELSEKYAKLSEEKVILWQENQDLITENHQLKERLTTLEAQLQQTQKELTEANNLLIEMRLELNNWKIDVLGFRDEMRDAEKAQLEALFKILKILGGEAKVESDQGEIADSTTAPSTEPNQPKPQETPTIGEQND